MQHLKHLMEEVPSLFGTGLDENPIAKIGATNYIKMGYTGGGKHGTSCTVLML